MRHLISIFFILFTALGMSSSYAEQYTVGVESIDYMPYYGVKNNQWRGYSKELLDLFGKKENIKITYEIRTVKQLYNDYINKRKFDFKFPDNPYWESGLKKRVKLHYSAAVVLYTDAVMVKNENLNIGKNDIQSIGLVAGFTPPAQYLKMEQEKSLIIVRSDTLRNLVSQVIQGEIQGIYINTDVGKRLAGKLTGGKTSIYFNNKLPYLLGSYQLSSIRHPGVIKRFDAFMTKESKHLARMKRKYGLK